MKTDGDKKNILSDVRTSDIRSTIVSDLVNVTWRMTVPTVLGIAIGMGADKLFNSSPAGFLVGAIIGFSLGIYLAIKLLKEVSETEK